MEIRKTKVDIQKARTWVKYKPALCQGCYAGCCTLPVKVSSEDLYHMGYLKAEQVEGPLKRIAQKLKKEGVIRSFHAQTRVFTLQQQNGTDCVFLDENRRCTIYDKRPAVCREFPFNSERPGYCPNQKISKLL